MVVSFPPAEPSDESSDSLAPVTSLFAHRGAQGTVDDDGWFEGVPDDVAPAVTESGASRLRPVVQLRRGTDPKPEHNETVSVPVDAPGPEVTFERAAETPRVAWTTQPSASAPIVDDAEVEVVADPVDPEVRLAELDLLAVRRLARRGCSEWEVAELLRGHDAEAHEVEHILEELRRRGYLDDAELARHLVESLHTRKGQSRAVIARELSARRIDQAVASEALEAIDDDDELRRALVVAEKRAGQLSSLDHATAERRLTAYLARRGYGSAIIREACSRALAGSRRSGVSFR